MKASKNADTNSISHRSDREIEPSQPDLTTTVLENDNGYAHGLTATYRNSEAAPRIGDADTTATQLKSVGAPAPVDLSGLDDASASLSEAEGVIELVVGSLVTNEKMEVSEMAALYGALKLLKVGIRELCDAHCSLLKMRLAA